MPLRLAVDAMGGDHAPGQVVEGALAAARELGVEIVLVGRPERIKGEIDARGGAPGVTVQPASEVIEMTDSPVQAVRRKKDSSVVVGMSLVAQGEAAAFISAGSTGALLAAGIFQLGRIKGIDRPAYGIVLPTRTKPVVLLDGGANTDNKPEHLLQFAVMGSIYAEQALGRPDPRVVLLNNGTEAGKGNDLTKAAYPLLAASGLNFGGNFEARDLPEGGVDVVVCDGFVGNVVLKLFEGMGLSLMAMVREALTATFWSKLGALLAKPGLKRMARQLDYNETGGAPLLGLKAPVIKCHGSSKATAVKNGIRVARDLVAGQAVEAIARRVQDLGSPPDTAKDQEEART